MFPSEILKTNKDATSSSSLKSKIKMCMKKKKIKKMLHQSSKQ